MGVNKYASTFPMASCIRKRVITEEKITPLRKYQIDPKAYLGRC